MATNTSAVPLLIEKNLLMAVKLYDEQARIVYADEMAGNIIDTDQAYETIAQVNGLDLPQITAELGVVPITDMTQGPSAQYKGQKRTLSLRISDEAFIDDQYGIVRGYARELKTAFDQAREFAGAIFLNGCINTGLLVLPTGQTLASQTQPLQSGTDTNTFMVNQQTLSIIALEDARANLMNQKAYKGYPAPKVGPMVLEVAPKNGLLAERLTGAKQFPTTPNNDPNPLGASVSKVITNPYFTNPEWWCLRMADNSRHKRFKLVRYGFRLMNKPRFDDTTDSWVVAAKEKYLYGAMDYRGQFFSTPN
jgi:hypothetical protein